MSTRARRFIAISTRRAALIVSFAAAMTAPGSRAFAAAPAAGGERLIESMQRAPATVVGDVLEVEVLDRRGRRATLRVESVLRGPDDPRFAAGADGAGLRVAFEERVPTRPDRFAPGDRVLVVLEPLPGASIWLQRLPAPAERSATLSVAADGNAFLRRPALGSIRILEHYLALPAAEQLGPAGVPHLAALAEGASPPLSIDAVNTLQRIPRLDPLIDAVSARRLVAALLRADAKPRLEEALLALIERKQLQSLRTPLGAYAERARNAGATGDAPPVIYAALARLDGGLEPSDREALARSESSERRLAWVRSASEAGDAARLEQWLRGDPSPEVRAAAASKLAGLEGMRAEPPLLEALGDEGPGVREAAIAGLAELGPAAVPGLVERLGDEAAEPSEASSDPAESRASVAAIRALSLIRPEGTAALAEIADDHPSAPTRAAARLALGRPLVEPH